MAQMSNFLINNALLNVNNAITQVSKKSPIDKYLIKELVKVREILEPIAEQITPTKKKIKTIQETMI